MLMHLKKIKVLIILPVVLIMILMGCKSQRTIVDSPDLFLNYNMYPAKEYLVPIEKGYRDMTKKTKKEKVYQQGFSVEYAVTLALMEKYKDAFEWFDKEVEDYPLSKNYVYSLKKQMIPDSVLYLLEMDKQRNIEKQQQIAAEKKTSKLPSRTWPNDP